MKEKSEQKDAVVREREVEKLVTARYFASTLRRVADAIERGESFRIQVKNRSFVVPKDAELLVEHEVEGDHQELSFELLWKMGDKEEPEGCEALGPRPEPAESEAGEPEEEDEEEEIEDEDEER